MPHVNYDSECDLCLGTGWVTEPPIVIGQNEDRTDILSEPRISMCRCAWVDVKDPDSEEEDWDDESAEEQDEDMSFGGSLVLA